jgi:hypothetical protein
MSPEDMLLPAVEAAVDVISAEVVVVVAASAAAETGAVLPEGAAAFKTNEW